MKAYFETKTGAVQYARDQLANFEHASPLTIHIEPERSGVYSVSCVTATELDGTQKKQQSILKQLMNTFQEITPAGLSRQR